METTIPLGGRPVALVVDDEIEVLRFLAAALEGHGFRTETVESGEAALEWLQASTADLLVLDQFMPGLTGLDVAARVRRDGFTGPVILFTAFLDEILTRSCRRLDIHPLSKVDSAALNRVVGVLASELQRR